MFTHCPPLVLPNLISKTQENGKRYYVTPNGKKLPSVTTVIGAMKKDTILQWRERVGEEEANRVSRMASGRGNRVHLLAEKYLKNEEINLKVEMPDSAVMFRSLLKSLTRINNIQYQEQTLWSEKIGMAGRVDLIAEFDGVLSVIDYKTSERVKKKEDIMNYFAQCTSYSLMYEELIGKPIDQIVVLMAVQNQKEPTIFVEKTKDHLDNLLEHIIYYRKTLAN